MAENAVPCFMGPMAIPLFNGRLQKQPSVFNGSDQNWSLCVHGPFGEVLSSA